MSRDEFEKDINVIHAGENLHGKRLGLVLCEERLDIDYIHDVLKPNCECVVGYVEV